MQALQNLRVNRRITAWVMLFGLLFSGQLFCIMGVNAAPLDSSVDHHASHPCCPDADSGSEKANVSCCEDPASFCCGEAKSTSTPIQFEAPQAILLFSVLSAWLEPIVESIPTVARWTTDITLRRSDPPIHLVNCSFLY
jgi:hypothetical protein